MMQKLGYREWAISTHFCCFCPGWEAKNLFQKDTSSSVPFIQTTEFLLFRVIPFSCNDSNASIAHRKDTNSCYFPFLPQTRRMNIKLKHPPRCRIADATTHACPPLILPRRGVRPSAHHPFPFKNCRLLPEPEANGPNRERERVGKYVYQDESTNVPFLLRAFPYLHTCSFLVRHSVP